MKSKIFTMIFFALLNSCYRETSELKTVNNSEAVQKYLNTVIVAGTYGRSGSGGGVSDLVERLRNELIPLGVPSENVYVQSWNLDGDNAPGPDPSTGRHGIRVKSIIDNLNTPQPSYLALFGHSFGGWATAKLSQKLHDDIGIVADRVFLLDPVIYFLYRRDENQDNVVTKNGVSWYQTNAISTAEINHCAPITSCDYLADISCGQQFDGITNTESKYQRSADGTIKRKSCIFGTSLRKRQVHTTIDDDAYLQQTIFNSIVTDIKIKIAEINALELEQEKLKIEKRNDAIATIYTLYDQILSRSPTPEELESSVSRLLEGVDPEIIAAELTNEHNILIASIIVSTYILN